MPSAADNPVIRTWGEPAAAGSSPPHWEIGERLGLFDLERGAKISGSGFILYTGAGARLQRALIGLMLELAERHGYREVWSPILVNAASARGTGQLPDKEGQMYVVERDDLYLIPTAEVPVTNLYRDEILPGDDLPDLPRRLHAVLPSRGRRGRQGHPRPAASPPVRQGRDGQVRPARRPAGTSSRRSPATPRRCSRLSRSRTARSSAAPPTSGFAPAKGYDLEAWSPGVGKWLEVSSCSNYTDFQARRMNLRYRAARPMRDPSCCTR